MPVPPTNLKPWKLLKTTDISPSKWFSIENREYQLPNGAIVDDFTVSTLGDVAMIIPITKSGEVVMVRQFKPGFGDIIIEFPAGRMESKHTSLEELAHRELEEETGIKSTNLEFYARLSASPTKGTEKTSCYLAKNVEFNSKQKFDRNEDIEVLTLLPSELDMLIASNQIQTAPTIAAWVIAKAKFPDIFNL